VFMDMHGRGFAGAVLTLYRQKWSVLQAGQNEWSVLQEGQNESKHV